MGEVGAQAAAPRDPSSPQISNGIFLTIPGTEKSVGKVTAGEVTGLTPEVWPQIRPLGTGAHQAATPTQPAPGVPFGAAKFREVERDDRTDNRGWVFSAPRNYCLCPGDKASEDTGHVRNKNTFNDSKKHHPQRSGCVLYAAAESVTFITFMDGGVYDSFLMSRTDYS